MLSAGDAVSWLYSQCFHGYEGAVIYAYNIFPHFIVGPSWGLGAQTIVSLAKTTGAKTIFITYL